MSDEIEAAAGVAFAGFLKFRQPDEHAPPPGMACANCATPLLGRWCHQCGQVAEDFHRSIWKLIGEVFEGLAHFDGRVWATLPDLFRHPARLTRTYLDGHRAPQIPPFRLFLVVLVIVFLAGSLGQESRFAPAVVSTGGEDSAGSFKIKRLDELTPEQRAEVKQGILDGDMNGLSTGWLKDHMARAVDDPERFWLVLEGWSERFAFLALPMAALLISVAFAFQRRFFIFDHTVFSLHSLSAVGLMLAASEALSPLFGRDAEIILLGAPIHLFMHMRGVYGTGIIGTLARMAFVFVGSVIIGTVIFIGFLLVGLNGMGE